MIGHSLPARNCRRAILAQGIGITCAINEHSAAYAFLSGRYDAAALGIVDSNDGIPFTTISLEQHALLEDVPPHPRASHHTSVGIKLTRTRPAR